LPTFFFFCFFPGSA